jgi:MFS family permease
MASWNAWQKPFEARYQWTDEEALWWSVILTTASNLGATLSALSTGYFMKFGKLTMFHIMNLLVIIGSSLSLVDNMYVICIARFFFGIAAGGMTVYSPNYINETVPTELKGPLGALCQVGFCFGIFLPSILGLAIPDDPFEEDSLNSFSVQ